MELIASANAMEAEARARGLAIKRRNVLTTVAFAGLLALLLGLVFPATLTGSLVGFLVGVLYANAFEYVFHRVALHRAGSLLGQEHGVHHTTWGGSDEALYVNFAKTPWAVVGLFTMNAVPVALVEWAFGVGAAPGVLAAFALYFILFEDIHWRIHLGKLPAWLAFARRHHLEHHAGQNARFNVFLPLLDWLLGTHHG